MERWSVDAQATTIDVTATIYHTIDHAVAHNEGETYTVADYNALMTLVGCGFVALAGPPTTTATVPDVTGQTQAAATSTITGAGFTVGAVTQATDPVVPAGSVVSQTPSGGTTAALGSAVDLVVSTGP